MFLSTIFKYGGLVGKVIPLYFKKNSNLKRAFSKILNERFNKGKNQTNSGPKELL